MRHDNPGSASAHAVAADQPVLRRQLNEAEHLAKRFDAALNAIDSALDRLTVRTPRPVDERTNGGSITPVMPTIENSLSLHNAQLEELCRDAEALLARINRAV